MTGLSVGPLIGAQIAAVSSVSTVYIVGACISGLTILLSLFALKESMPPARRAEAAAQRATQTGSIWSVIARPAVLTLLIVMFLAQFAFFSFQTTFGLWAQLEVFKGAAQAAVQNYVSYALTLVGVVGVIVQLRLIGPLVQRFGERTMMQIGLVSRALFFFALASTPLGWMMFVAAPLLAFGTGMFLPTSAALSTYAAPDRRGQIIGVAQSAGSLGSIFGPILAGYVFEHIAHSAALYTAGGLTALAVLVSLGLLRFKLERPAPASAPRVA